MPLTEYGLSFLELHFLLAGYDLVYRQPHLPLTVYKPILLQDFGSSALLAVKFSQNYSSELHSVFLDSSSIYDTRAAVVSGHFIFSKAVGNYPKSGNFGGFG